MVLVLHGNAQHFMLADFGRAWTLLGSRKKLEAKVPSVQCIIPVIVRDALLGAFYFS